MVFSQSPNDSNKNSHNRNKSNIDLFPVVTGSLPEEIVKELQILEKSELDLFLKYYTAAYVAPLSEDDVGISVHVDYGAAIFLMVPFASFFYVATLLIFNNFGLYNLDFIQEHGNYITWLAAVIGSMFPVVHAYIKAKIQKKKIIQTDIKETIAENGEVAREILKYIRGYRTNNKK